MILHSHWKARGPSELVKDSEGREYEISTFEGGRSRIDPSLPPRPWAAGPMGTEVRASVFLMGGRVQFTVTTVAQLPHMQTAFEAVKQETRRRILEDDWEADSHYEL